MELDEETIRRLKERGGRYTTDFEQIGARVSADNKLALKQICTEQKWNIGNVLDWLIEGFIANYREMWPVEGQYQLQLPHFVEQASSSDETPQVGQQSRSNVVAEYERQARELFFYPTRLKIKNGEDVSQELAIMRSCLERAKSEGNDHAVANITHWLTTLEEMMASPEQRT